jgi:hypothetical protein
VRDNQPSCTGKVLGVATNWKSADRKRSRARIRSAQVLLAGQLRRFPLLLSITCAARGLANVLPNGMWNPCQRAHCNC